MNDPTNSRGTADTWQDPPLTETLARAEAAVAEFTANYDALVLEDLAQCRAALNAVKAEPAQRGAHLKRLYEIVHNIKGQGSSFGYPLVTRIGQSMCNLIRNNAAPDDAQLQIVQAHLDALTLIIKNRIKGDGGETGAKLAQRLEALTGGTA